MQALLSFESAPPLAAPLRFFVTAPLFATLAGLLLMVGGGDVLASRWAPAALAATHLITVGFMLQVMIGALIQILPVVAGANLSRPLAVARGVHAGLSAGGLVLAASFLMPSLAGFMLAATLLGGTSLVFVLATGRALRGVPSTSPTIRGIKLALAGLAVVVLLGVILSSALARGWSIDLPLLADLHAGWGFGAWAGGLLVAMAYVVVPMFQLTPPYPLRWSWWFPVVLIASLLLWTLAVLLGAPWLIRLAQGLLALAGTAFALYTLRLQGQRRRARSDATFHYWRGGLASTVAAMVMLLVAAVRPGFADLPTWPLLFGILLGVGGFMSMINGMIYKIVPFLAWLHLQNAGQGRVPAPNVIKLLPEKRAQGQMRAHFIACSCLAAAVVWPDLLAAPAGAAFALANGWLAFNLFGTLKLYGGHLALISGRTKA